MKTLVFFTAMLFLFSTCASADVTMTPGILQDRGFVLDNTVHHTERGDIHFSLYVPDSYDGTKAFPLYIALPGWEGLYFQGVGADLRWETLPFAAREYQPDMIIVSTQLNDWGQNSALDVIALTEWLLSAYRIDPDRVYLSGLSGGGETGSLIMELRPDLYAAYLMVASQWDGEMTALTDACVPVYMIIGEGDSYYGSDSLRGAYHTLVELYRSKGLSEHEISELVVLNVKGAAWFASKGYADQHAGAITFSEEPGLLEWFFSKIKEYIDR